ncbi:MAG: heparinase II/III family protein [Candidatus Brocadiia bacterium]
MRRVALFITGVLSLLTGAVYAEIEPDFPPPPRLATTREQLSQTKKSPKFEEIKKAALRKAKRHLESPLSIPDKYGSWYFYYACPEDGSRLKPLSPQKHKCPKCGKIYTTERIVAAYRGIMHSRLDKASLSLGWAYAYSGTEKYAHEVKRILTGLADRYDSYPERIDRWGHHGMLARLGGRRYVQSLDEATSVIKLAKAYDLTRTCPVWSQKEKQHVEEDLFRLISETLLVFNQGRSNHQTWYNAGLMAIASVLEDKELVRKTLTMKGGYFDQLDRSVGQDGLWFEGTMAYHRYALQAMLEIVEAGQKMGLPLHKHPKFKAMIRGPIVASYPNGRFPAINDSDPMSIGGFHGYFKWAWETYQEPIFARAYAAGDARKVHKLLGEDAELQWPLTTGSKDLPDAGLVKLEIGQGQKANCIFFDYGPHGGGHGHYDKLNITLYAMGREWLLDPGRLSYRHKEYKTWVKHTCAHNTVTIGGKTQKATTGRLLWLKKEENYAACAAESTGAYPGGTLRRYLFLTPSVLVDIFQVETPEETQIDLFTHARASKIAPRLFYWRKEEAQIGSKNGYQHFSQIKRWHRPKTDAFSSASWIFSAEKNLQLPLVVCSTGKQRFFTGYGIGYRINQREPCLIRRVTGRRAIFATIFELSPATSSERSRWLSIPEAKGDSIHAVLKTSGRAWGISLNPDGVVLK